MWQTKKLLVKKQGITDRPFPYIFNAIAIGLIVVFLAACGGSQSSSSTSSNGKIVITEMDYWSVPAQGATLTGLFKQYEQLHPNVTIQRDAVPFASLIPKADQEAASHTLPSLLVLDNPSVAAFASTGALTPLDSFMQGQFNE